MSRPGLCPNCAAALIGETAAVAILDDSTGDGGWDCYCASCGWSGDVYPDDEQGGAVGGREEERGRREPRERPRQGGRRGEEGMADEDRAWLESDLSRLSGFGPYEWAEGELEAGEPVGYVPGVGAVAGDADLGKGGEER